MVGRGEGVEAWYDELPNPCSCIEAGGQAGEDGCVKGVVEGQLQAKLGDEVRGLRLPLLSFGGRWGESLGGSEDRL